MHTTTACSAKHMTVCRDSGRLKWSEGDRETTGRPATSDGELVRNCSNFVGAVGAGDGRRDSRKRQQAQAGEQSVWRLVDSSSRELNSASRLGTIVIATTALPRTFRDRLKQHLKPCAACPTLCSLDRPPTSITTRCRYICRPQLPIAQDSSCVLRLASCTLLHLAPYLAPSSCLPG